MAVSSETTVIIPAEERGWEVWQWTKQDARLRRTVSMLDELPAGGRNAIVGVPAQECTTLPVNLPTADQALFPEMVYSQLEKRGLVNGDPEHAVHSFHVIERESKGSLLTADVLPGDFNEDYCLSQAQGYTAAGRLYPIPDHKLVIVKEHGRLVMLAGKHGRMIFSQIMNCGDEIGPAFLQELNLNIFSLQGSGLLAERVNVEIWTDVPGEQQVWLSENSTHPVEFLPRPKVDPRLVKDAQPPMLPLPVRAAVLKKQRAQKIRTGILLGVLVYTAIAVFLTLYFQTQNRRAMRLEDQVSRDRPEVAMLERAAARQQALLPATEKDLFPVLQLDRISQVMPPSGIALRDYQVNQLNIRIRGQARDAQLAFQFLEDLKNHPEFPGYTWAMPQPAMGENNVATFDIQGQYALANP